MFLFDWLFWPLIVYFTIVAIESYFLISGRYYLKLGLPIWREDLSERYKSFFITLKNSIIYKSNFFQSPDYIIKDDHRLKIYFKRRGRFFFIPLVAFINLNAPLPKLSYYCPIFGCFWNVPFFLILLLPVIFQFLPSPTDLGELFNLALIVSLPLTVLYSFIGFKVSRKDIHQFIERQIEQSSI